MQTSLNNSSAQELAGWSLQLMQDDVFRIKTYFDPHLFSLMYAACACARQPPRSSILSCEGMEADLTKSDRLLGTLKELQRTMDVKTSGEFARFYLLGIEIHSKISLADTDEVQQAFSTWCNDVKKENDHFLYAWEKNITSLSKLMELNEAQTKLLSFFLHKDNPGFRSLFNELFTTEYETLHYLSKMFNLPEAEVVQALAEDGLLVSSGLCKVYQQPLKLGVMPIKLQAALLAQTDEADPFFERFVKPLTKTPSTASLSRLDDRDHDILIQLMSTDIVEGGLHSLIYGPASVDKKGMVVNALSAHTLYEVNNKGLDSTDLPVWTTIAQHWVKEHAAESVLIVDKADNALASRTTSAMMFLLGLDDSNEEELLSDQGLTSKKIRCVWLVDNPNFLTEKNLGRFIFHCQARPSSRAERRQSISNVVEEFNLSKDLERELAKYSLLGEQQVRQAARLATLLYEDAAERETVIRRAVEQSQKVLGREQTEELHNSVTKYSLEHLNVAGRFTPTQIMHALSKKPAGTLCLYGLPGAGKTQFVEHLAIELDLPILHKRASDILEKWLGESEKHIAAMFAEAEAEGAILFLDEADSFMRDRSLARAEWSVTQVNELLQHMERFPGLFIAATNLMQDIDAAALRRFTFKLEFLPLKPEQAWAMFVAESEYTGNDEDYREQLANIANLTPGDFATVKRQANLLDQALSPQEWLDQLAAEAKAKMHGLVRNHLGF